MYQIFLEKYAALTLSVSLVATAVFLGIAAIGEFIALRQSRRKEYAGVPFVQAMRKSRFASFAFAIAFGVTLIVTAPLVGGLGFCFGLIVVLLRCARANFFPEEEIILWTAVVMGLFAALLPAPDTQHAPMSALYAAVALAPLPLLKLYQRYRHELFVVLFWD
jgi:hypothetical protein